LLNLPIQMLAARRAASWLLLLAGMDRARAHTTDALVLPATPGIHQDIAKLKQGGCYAMALGDSPVLKSFYRQKKSSKVKASERANSFRYFNDLSPLQLGFSDDQAFDLLVVSDEAKARDFEQKIGHVQEAGPLRVQGPERCGAKRGAGPGAGHEDPAARPQGHGSGETLAGKLLLN